MEVVHHNAADAPFQSLFELPFPLVVPMEIDLVERKSGGLGHMHLTAGDNIESKAFLVQEANQGLAGESLAGVDGQCVGVTLPELSAVLGTFGSEGGLIEDIEGCTVGGCQCDGVTATNSEVSLVIQSRSVREEGQFWQCVSVFHSKASTITRRLRPSL